jgi:uncharacterized protein YdcH (DUF465 family)
MEHREEELIHRHAAHDQELRAAYEQHQALKHQLELYRHKHFLTSDEEVEMKRIQKMKLASKDKIMEILNRHQHEPVQ